MLQQNYSNSTTEKLHLDPAVHTFVFVFLNQQIPPQQWKQSRLEWCLCWHKHAVICPRQFHIRLRRVCGACFFFFNRHWCQMQIIRLHSNGNEGGTPGLSKGCSTIATKYLKVHLTKKTSKRRGAKKISCTASFIFQSVFAANLWGKKTKSHSHLPIEGFYMFIYGLLVENIVFYTKF